MLIGIAAAALLATVAYTGYFQLARGAADASLVAQARAVVQQAAYRLAVEAADVDGDGYMEAPTMGAGSKVPTAGGVVPASSAAPKTDSWGTALGYCSWDNGAGSRNSSAGRITGDSDSGTSPAVSANSVVLAVVSAGPNKTFDTTCATARTGAAGDDVVQRFTHAQIVQGMGGTAYFGDPVTAATLSGINPGATRDGQLRLQKDTNTLMRWDNAASAWKQVGSSSGPAGATTLKNALINGTFELWQRGTSSSPDCGWLRCYAADRWIINGSSTTAGGSYTSFARYAWNRVPVTDTGGPDLPAYALRVTRLSKMGAANPPVDMEVITQRIEDVRTLAGQTVTGSFWVKLDAGQKWLCYDLYQYVNSGRPVNRSFGRNCYLATTTWTKQTFTVALPKIDPYELASGNWEHALWFRPVMEPPGTSSTPRTDSFSVSIAEAQVEVGSVATAIERRLPAFELMLAKRYYEMGTVTSMPEAVVTDSPTYFINWAYVYYSVVKRSLSIAPVFTAPMNANIWCQGNTRITDYTYEYLLAFRQSASTQGWRCAFVETWVVDAEMYQ
ncbi:hypothetical protein E4K72_03570 [Oxalobacteraceae bacterium OM1]|nr:hypothetical protein E4K72_03570 [Oxalobacteraceae bacterium OM1]